MTRHTIVILATSLLLLAIAAFAGDRALKSRNHPGLRTFLKQWWTNYPASFAVEPKDVHLSVDQRDLDALEAVVQAARERGVIMAEGNDYVPAEFTVDGVTFKAKVRIKGKMADHVEGDKWSFRVIARKDNGFLGMQRFSLQHPGTRNYLCDWFYHRLMQGEGIIALRYGFVRLHFNGQDLGIYAYEEHFGPELLAHNGRVKGPIFRFDPGLFWEHRLNMLQKVRYNEAFGAYQAAALDAFGSSELEKDSVQRILFEEVVARMDAFRRSQLKASEVFDADKLGRRHAILDLIGGHHSMDWSDVKFYYDPVLKRVEPVAYESFSAFPIRTLAGADRYVGEVRPSMDLHDAYFNDPVVFAAYVRHLERVSRPAYLDSTYKVLGPALDSASALIYREFPYKELDKALYSGNQLIIRRMLDVPKGFHAYAARTSDTLRMTIVPVESLPMEIHGVLAADGSLIPPAARTIIPCRRPSGPGVPVQVDIPLNDTWRASAPERVVVRYSVLGASTKKDLEAFPYAYTDGLAIPAFNAAGASSAVNEPMFRVDSAARTFHLVPGVHQLDHDVFIPAGYTVMATSPLIIDLRRGARIVSRSALEWSGLEDAPIVLRSSDLSGGGLLVHGTGSSSTFKYVRIEDLGTSTSGTPAIVFQEADVEWRDCSLGGARSRDLFMSVRSSVGFERCRIVGGKDQISLAFGAARMTTVELFGGGDDAVVLKGGTLTVDATVVVGAMGSGLDADENAEVHGEGLSVRSIKDALRVSEGVRLTLQGGEAMSSEGVALHVAGRHDRHGPSRIVINGMKMSASGTGTRIGKNNEVVVDGRTLTATEPRP